MKLTEIKDNLKKNLNIEELTPVQKRIAELAGTPLLRLVAPTGSGKTVAFTINLLLQIEQSKLNPQALIVVPTRELAIQVTQTIKGSVNGTLRVVTLYGGHNFTDETNSLAAGADIIVGTPGRILDHLSRNTLNLSEVSHLILDEYDKSLELGFEKDMKKIHRHLPSLRKVLLTSATESVEIPAYIGRCRDFKMIAPIAEDQNDTTPKFDIVRVISYERDKLHVASDLLATLQNQPTIVFVNHRESAERVANYLSGKGFPIGIYHGGLDQTTRENALEMFANSSTPTLIATDLAARGLDVAGVENIIHYNLPSTPEAWTHRNGRTSRMGKEGTVYVITGEDEPMGEFITWDREFQPPHDQIPPKASDWSTLLFSLGKREKISKGDILGFLIANTCLGKEDIGRIVLRDHTSLVAVNRSKAQTALKEATKTKIKNQRVKITLL